MKNLIIELGLQDYVELTGKLTRDEMLPKLSVSNIFVLPSNSETFGVVYIEAMALGLPVIATKCGGPEDMVSEGVNGWLYPVGDYMRLSEILSNIQNGKYILPKAEVCIDSIQKFDEQVVINKIEEVIIKTYYKFYGFTRL